MNTDCNDLLYDAVIITGKKRVKSDLLSSSSKNMCSLPPRDVVGKVYRRDGRIGSETKFLRQADVLRDIGRHDLIVELVAVLRDDVALPCLVLELAPHSDLQSYLVTDVSRRTSLPKLITWAIKVENRLIFHRFFQFLGF